MIIIILRFSLKLEAVMLLSLLWDFNSVTGIQAAAIIFFFVFLYDVEEYTLRYMKNYWLELIN